ncbi:MAG: thiamine pyrophosphate-dependent enzyme [Comamonadaceae bacterium]|nr:thiamine pyrophosphate-dependent enzyme [Comamonadaceae bacterium]
MSYQPIKFYQTGTFTVGNRLLPTEAALGAGEHASAPTRSTPATAPARAAARRSARATRSTPRCDATNGQLIAANATGCLEVFSTPYPETSWQIPWIHSLFGNAAAVATGIAAAMRVKGRSDVRVVAQGGDGGTTDIGFGCLSGMFERNDDVLYICYDNEAYMNTGVQRSSATPPAARTATTMPVGHAAGQRLRPGQEPAARSPWRTSIPYVATATVAELRDLEAKVRARDGVPRRALHPHPRALPARLGHGLGTTPSRMARLAHGDRPVPGVRGRARRGDRASRRSAASCRSRST